MIRWWQKARDNDPEARHTYNMLPKAYNKVYVTLEKYKREIGRAHV